MYTITTKLPQELNLKLEKLAQISDRTKSYLVRKAVEHFVNEKEDYFVALERLEQGNIRYTLAEVEAEDELENRI